MKFIFKIVLFFVTAYTILQLSISYNSHVIFILANQRIDLSLLTMIVTILFAFIILYFLIFIIEGIYSIPNDFKEWVQKLKIKKASTMQELAITNYLLGNHNDSYYCAEQYIGYTKDLNKHMLALSIMLLSASHNKNIEIDIKNIDKFNAITKNSYKNNIDLFKAIYLFSRGDFFSVIELTLKYLKINSQNMTARLLLIKAYINISNYDKALAELLLIINNDNTLYKNEIKMLRTLIYDNLFATIHEDTELSYFFRKIQKDDIIDDTIFRLYLKSLFRLKKYNIIIEFLSDNMALLSNNLDLLLSFININNDIKFLQQLINLLTNKTNDNLSYIINFINIKITQIK
jgi:uncharacterized protein HemY